MTLELLGEFMRRGCAVQKAVDEIITETTKEKAGGRGAAVTPPTAIGVNAGPRTKRGSRRTAPAPKRRTAS